MKELLKTIDQEKLHAFILNYLQQDEQFEVAFKLAFAKPTEGDLSSILSRIDDSLEKSTDMRAYIIDIPEDNEYLTRAKQGHIRFAFDAARYLFERLVKMHDCFSHDCDVDEYLDYRLSDFDAIAKLATDREDKAYIFNGCLELSDLDFSECLDNYEKQFVDISATLLAKENHLRNKADLSFFEDTTHGDMFNENLLEKTITMYGKEAGAKLAL
ncbi:MAG: hypothetical protein LBT59_00495 [Clostridiales bacterium]|nr:hypothetical protein [Clostridiales bacterium]